MNLRDETKKYVYLYVHEFEVGSVVHTTTNVERVFSAGSETLFGQEICHLYRANVVGRLFQGIMIALLRALTSCVVRPMRGVHGRVGQTRTCKTLTTCPCDVETKATTTDRSEAPAPPSADVLLALPSSVPAPLLLEGERFDLGGDDGSDAGRRGSRDKNTKGIDTTSWAIRVI